MKKNGRITSLTIAGLLLWRFCRKRRRDGG
jgi:hypothetical protein